jgi:phage terminase large subunit-like protein
MPKDDLLALARKFQEHQVVTQHAKGDLYLKTAHEKQLAFHKAQNRVRIFLGGNRSGKTTAGTNELRWVVEGTHPFRKFRVPVKACIVCQDFQTHAKDIIIPKLIEWFPPGLVVRVERNQSGVEVKFHCKNGATIDIKSHEQDIKVFEGSDYDFVWFDEPPPEQIFKALWRGLTDRRGSAVFTGTPITEPWLHDLYQKAASEHNNGLYWATFASIHENVKNIGEGSVEEGKARIAEFLDALDPDEREAREKGHFLHMRGLIFKGWRRDTHLIPPFKWPNQWPVYISLDPHPRKPWALSFLGLSPGGFRFLISSYQVEGVVEDVAQHVLWAKGEIELDRPGAPRIQSCWIDNYASVESMIKKSTTIIEELNRLVSPAVPRFRPAPKNVEEKISIFKSWLKVQDTKFGKRPGFMVFDTPENKDFIYEIEHYVWASQRGAKRNLLKNVPVKENDDILDTIMQLALVLDSRKRQDASNDSPKIIKYAGRQ